MKPTLVHLIWGWTTPSGLYLLLAWCEKWLILFSCMLLIVFFPPLERVLPTLPNPFPGQYMLYIEVAL